MRIVNRGNELIDTNKRKNKKIKKKEEEDKKWKKMKISFTQLA